MTAVPQKHLERLPLFPLPSAFLFPRTFLPLHVFEPRYRAMVTWCLSRRWPIGIVCIRPGFERHASGNPPLMTVGTLGEIARHEKLDNGRYNLMLRGVSRVQLLAEQPSEGAWRVSQVKLLSDRWPEDRRGLEDLVQTAHACLLRLRPHFTAISESLGRSVHTRDAAHLADILSSVAFDDDSERQSLLECTDVEVRLRTAVDRLALLVADTAPRDEPVH